MFSGSLRQRIATAAVGIEPVDELRKELNPTYNLATGNLRVHASDIVAIRQATISPIWAKTLLFNRRHGTKMQLLQNLHELQIKGMRSSISKRPRKEDQEKGV